MNALSIPTRSTGRSRQPKPRTSTAATSPGRLQGVTNRLVKAATCLYTVTPDAGFVVDRLQEDGSVIVASACSGHGFKHSPAMGEHLAALALDAGTTAEPSFALGRFA